MVWIPALFVFGEELFTKQTPRIAVDPHARFWLAGFGLIQVLLYAWAWALRLVALAEVHGISRWRVVGALLLSWLLTLLALVGVAVAIYVGTSK